MNISGIVLCNSIDDEIKNYLCDTYVKFTNNPKKGLVLEGLMNPDNTKIQKIQSIIGVDINYDLSKVGNHVYKMVSPSRLNLRGVAERLCKCISMLNAQGKSKNALNNAYYRFLCWMHFEFSGILKGTQDANIQYWGSLNPYSLMMLYIVGVSGVVVTNTEFEASLLSDLGIKYLPSKSTEKIQDGLKASNLLNDVSVPKPRYTIGTNMWLKGDKVDEIFTPYEDRVGSVDGLCTNSALIRVSGVADRTTYIGELYNMYSSHKDTTVIVNSDFMDVTPNDINALRGRYRSDDLTQYLLSLCLSLGLDKDVYDTLVVEFLKILDSVTKNKEQMMLTMFFILKNIIKGRSFKDRHYLYFLQTNPITSVQANVLYLISCMMFDVVIFNPNRIESGAEIPYIYEMNFENKIDLKEFPMNPQSIVIETTAYNTENELVSLLYDGSAGIFKDNQFKDARVAYLKPMNEEIDILWGKDVSLRQGFGVSEGVVMIPTIFAEILGVKSGDTVKWCKRLNTLIEDKTIVCYNNEKSFFDGIVLEQIHSAEVIRGRVIDRALLKENKNYPYSYLSNDTQMYMISKLQELLDSGIIDGVYKHGVENEVLSVYRTLNNISGVVRLIQNFDFTKVSPKIVFTWMEQSKIPRPDIILLHYLNMLGFDVIVFVPTGYNVMDSYITKKVYTEYKEGIGVEPFSVRHNIKQSFFNKLFRR